MSLPVQPPGTIHVRRGTDQYGNTIWYFGDHAIRVDESGAGADVLPQGLF